MKKLLSVLIIAVMLFGLVPFAFAADATAYPTIAVGEVKKVDASRTQVESAFKFVPAESAEYSFYSTAEGKVDTYGYILNDKGEIIADNDDDDTRSGLSFGVFAQLEKGKTYTLYSRLYTPTEKGTYNVSVVKTGAKATKIVPDKAEYTLYVGDKAMIDYAFEPYAAIGEGVEASSSNSAVVSIMESGEICAEAVGSAVVTLTSENNLKADVKVNVVKPETLLLNKSYTAMLADYGDYKKYIFTPAETASYTFEVSSNGYGHINISGLADGYGSGMSVNATLTAGEEYVVEVMAESYDYSYTLSVSKTKIATDFFIEGGRGEIQSTHFSQAIYAYGVGGELQGEIEWSVDKPEIANIMDTASPTTYLSFNQAGTVTVTAKWNGKTQTYTVTGIEPEALTLGQPYKQEVVGFNNDIYAVFTPDVSGDYIFNVSDTANAPLRFSINDSMYDIDDSYKVYLEEGNTYFIQVGRFLVSNDYDENLTGDITLLVKKCVDPTGIVIDGGDVVTSYVNGEIFLTLSATNEGGAVNSPASWEVTGTEKYSISSFKDGAAIFFEEEGKYTVTATLGGFTDSIKVKVISPAKIKLGEKVEGTVGEPNYTYVLELDVEKAGVYTVRVKSDNEVSADAAYSGMDYGTNFELGVVALSIYPTYVSIHSDQVDANFTVELVDAKFPVGLRPYLPEVTLGIGDEYYPYLIFEPSTMYEEIKTVTSSNTNVVKVVGEEVIAVGEGTATVEYETEYGLKTQVKFTVVGDDYDWAYDIVLDKDELDLKAGESATLKATVEADSAKKVIWTSDDQSVARVDENGRVTGIAEGTAYITAVVDGLEAWCEVTVTAPAIQDSTKKFTDVKAGKWYTNAINYCYSYGFIKGKTDTTFDREDNITRAEFITILARIAGVNTQGNANKVKTKFTDVKSGKFYTNAIKWANENGIIKGTSDTIFGTNDNISRQDICVMVTRLAKYLNIELKASVAEMKFTDAGSINKYAKTPVSVCQKAGLIKGYKDGSFGPKKPAQRAEAAQILWLFHETFIAK